MFRSLLQTNISRTVLRSAATSKVYVPAMTSNLYTPIQKLAGVRFYSGFPDLTRELARERIYELLEGYEKVGTEKEVTDNSSFIQDLGLDSLDVVEVVMELEHEFNIQIPDHEADSLKTVGQTIDYIMAQPDAC